MASLNQAMGGREEAITPSSPRTWAADPAMSSRHIVRSNGRLTV